MVSPINPPGEICFWSHAFFVCLFLCSKITGKMVIGIVEAMTDHAYSSWEKFN